MAPLYGGFTTTEMILKNAAISISNSYDDTTETVCLSRTRWFNLQISRFFGGIFMSFVISQFIRIYLFFGNFFLLVLCTSFLTNSKALGQRMVLVTQAHKNSHYYLSTQRYNLSHLGKSDFASVKRYTHFCMI